jgi:hypothetical protein
MGRHLLKKEFQQSLCLILGTPLDFAPVGSGTLGRMIHEGCRGHFGNKMSVVEEAQ